jgi:hypothetical protein
MLQPAFYNITHPPGNPAPPHLTPDPLRCTTACCSRPFTTSCTRSCFRSRSRGSRCDETGPSRAFMPGGGTRGRVKAWAKGLGASEADANPVSPPTARPQSFQRGLKMLDDVAYRVIEVGSPGARSHSPGATAGDSPAVRHLTTTGRPAGKLGESPPDPARPQMRAPTAGAARQGHRARGQRHPVPHAAGAGGGRRARERQAAAGRAAGGGRRGHGSRGQADPTARRPPTPPLLFQSVGRPPVCLLTRAPSPPRPPDLCFCRLRHDRDHPQLCAARAVAPP